MCGRSPATPWTFRTTVGPETLGQPVDRREGPGARDDVPLIPADDDTGLTLLTTSNFSMNCLASKMSLQHVL